MPWYFILIWSLLSPMLLGAQCLLSARSSGHNSNYTQVYILVDELGRVVASNGSGTFTAPRAGRYRIHALNYDPANPPSPLPDALIGQDLALLGTVQNGCFNADVLTDYVFRDCAACQSRRAVCAGTPLVVSSTGSTAGYVQLYVLSNADGSQVLAANGTGDFTALIQTGQSYRVYALNYNPADPPQPLPQAGQPLAAVASQYSGCYNPDFFSDYLCVDVLTCPQGCFREQSVCPGLDLVASSSNANAAYTQVYVLSDDNDIFLAQNSTGIFSSLGLVEGQRYRIRALNYNPAEPPNPLPSAWQAGQSLAMPSQGCFNPDFMADFTCLRLSCVILQQNHLDLRGYVLAGGNRLDWQWQQRLKRGEKLRLERSYRPEQGQFELLAEWVFGQEQPQSYWDAGVFGAAYYRLVLENAAANEQLSSAWVYLERSKAPKSVKLYPNPNRGQAYLELQLEQAQQLDLRLYNGLGMEIKHWQQQLEAGPQTLFLEQSELAAGVYLLELSYAGEQVVLKWLVD